MASDKLLSAFLHYSIPGIIFLITGQTISIIGNLAYLPLLIVNPLTVMIYRKEYLEQFSDPFTEFIIGVTGFFLFFLYIMPGIYYMGQKGVKNSFTKK